MFVFCFFKVEGGAIWLEVKFNLFVAAQKKLHLFLKSNKCSNLGESNECQIMDEKHC